MKSLTKKTRRLGQLIIALALALIMVTGTMAGPAPLAFIEVLKDGDIGHGEDPVDGLHGAYSVIVSPDNKHVYAAGVFDDAIAAFSRDAGTGKLTFVEVHKDNVAPVDGLDGAQSVTVSPDNKHVYAAGEFDNAIVVFSRDAGTGALTFVEVLKDGVGPVDGLDSAQSVTVSPDNKHVYAAGLLDDAIAVFSRDAGTGKLSFVEMLKDGVGGVDGLDAAYSVIVSPDNKHVYAASRDDDAIAVFSRDAGTGKLSFVEMLKDGVGGVDGLDGAYSVIVSPDNQHVYATGSTDDAIAVFSRNASTGALTFVEMLQDGVGGVDGLNNAKGVTVSSDSQHVYAAGRSDNAIAVFGQAIVPTVLFGTNTIPANGANLATGPTQITVEFSEDMFSGDTDHSAKHVGNYILVEAGTNGNFDTGACNDATIPGGDDTQIVINTATYDGSDPFVATLGINSGTPLPVGKYQLLVCGTTSVWNAANTIELNGGASDTSSTFTVQVTTTIALPSTGFAMRRTTMLPAQPENKAYTETTMMLEIPKLDVSIPIVGVPQRDDTWDVTWLNQSAGYLAGSAFPTWAGNTVITGHVWDAYNQPGPFSELKNLNYGDQIQIEAWGLTYTYEVRESKLVTKKSVNKVLQSEEYDWVTLVTCEFYNPFTGDYLFRRAVRAVLVSVR